MLNLHCYCATDSEGRRSEVKQVLLMTSSHCGWFAITSHVRSNPVVYVWELSQMCPAATLFLPLMHLALCIYIPCTMQCNIGEKSHDTQMHGHMIPVYGHVILWPFGWHLAYQGLRVSRVDSCWHIWYPGSSACGECRGILLLWQPLCVSPELLLSGLTEWSPGELTTVILLGVTHPIFHSPGRNYSPFEVISSWALWKTWISSAALSWFFTNSTVNHFVQRSPWLQSLHIRMLQYSCHCFSGKTHTINILGSMQFHTYMYMLFK